MYDYRRSIEPGVAATEDQPTTPFAWLAGGALPPGLMLSAGWLFLTFGAISALWLTLLAGWPLLFFSGLSVLLVVGSFLPPVRYAMRGWGVGETGVAIGFGVLPFRRRGRYPRRARARRSRQDPTRRRFPARAAPAPLATRR